MQIFVKTLTGEASGASGWGCEASGDLGLALISRNNALYVAQLPRAQANGGRRRTVSVGVADWLLLRSLCCRRQDHHA
jgi:hypothetical protein